MTPPLKWLYEEIEVNLENVTTLTDKELDIAIAEKQRRILANLSDPKKKKDELTSITDNKELTQDSVEECPFPEHKWYTILWNSLKNNPEGQKQMKENFRITADRKIEVIKMHKKFSILTVERRDGCDLREWKEEDSDGKTWIDWLTYFSTTAAERNCKEQNKNLFNDKTELKQFISYFPWADKEEKCKNIFQLFDIGKTGFLRGLRIRWFVWEDVGSVGYIMFGERYSAGLCAYGLRWAEDYVGIHNSNSQKSYDFPYIAYEPIIN